MISSALSTDFAQCRGRKQNTILHTVCILQVLSSNVMDYGYNAARDCYEDLLAAGIMDPTKVLYLIDVTCVQSIISPVLSKADQQAICRRLFCSSLRC